MDIQRIENKLTELANYLEELSEFLPETQEEYETNTMAKRSSEKTFELASETIIDICNIIISENKFKTPQENRDSIERLVQNKILDKKLGEKLKDMIGFRNLLVHQYGKVDEQKAYKHLKEEIKDFEEFIESIQKYIVTKK